MNGTHLFAVYCAQTVAMVKHKSETAFDELKGASAKDMNPTVSGIYRLTFPNSKLYIGQSRNVHKRWGRYKSLTSETFAQKRCKNKVPTPVERAIVKYGWASITKEIVLTCQAKDLNEHEMRWIALSNSLKPNGYNLKEGGDASAHHPCTIRKMRNTWAGKREWTKAARKQQALNGGIARIELDRSKVASNNMTALSNTSKSKAKRKATWARKREEKLARMDPKKAEKVRRQAENDARRLEANGPPKGYAEYQAKRREEVRNERRNNGWLG